MRELIDRLIKEAGITEEQAKIAIDAVKNSSLKSFPCSKERLGMYLVMSEGAGSRGVGSLESLLLSSTLIRSNKLFLFI